MLAPAGAGLERRGSAAQVLGWGISSGQRDGRMKGMSSAGVGTWLREGRPPLHASSGCASPLDRFGEDHSILMLMRQPGTRADGHCSAAILH